MVPRHLQVFTPVFNSPTESAASSASSSGRQLRSELAQAVERTMVSTRSHDNTPVANGKKSTKEDGKDMVVSGKRKSQRDADATTPSQPAAKRRRAVDKLKSDVLSTPQIATAVVVEVKEQAGEGIREQISSEQEVRPQKILETAAPSLSRPPRPNSPGSNTHTERPLLDPVPVKMQQNDDRDEALNEEQDELRQLPSSPNPARTPKKWKKAKMPMEENETNQEPSTKDAEDINTIASPSKPSTSTHRRFHSTEPEPLQPQPHNQAEDIVTAPYSSSEDQESSDGEAPETVTASAGQAQALTATLEQSKAAAQLERKQKLKRRERDARLKEQANATKKKARVDGATKASEPKAAAVVEAGDEDDAPTSETKTRTLKHPLPALLPEHILVDEPAIRPLIHLAPPISKTGTLMNQKKKFLDLEQKPPKDIKRGGVKIRVLQEGSGVLPPKASQQGRTLREAWLLGRRGKGSVVERRQVKGQGGFVRR